MNPAQQLLTDHIGLWTGGDTARKSGRGRASGSAGTVYGIKKLRELILELAVRGKLVPQDPSDEPASALLGRIREEKARLVLDGKFKKDKPMGAITDDERPFLLPKSWVWVRLGDISSTVQYGYTDSANHQLKDVLFLRITDIQDDSVNWATVPGCSISLSDFDGYALENCDLVIARTGGTIGKSYLVTGLNQKAVFASYLIRIGNLSSTSAEYKKVFLGSILYWKQLLASSMGTGQPNVNGTALKNLIFSLPPLAEQHRIVAKVDELMALCDQLETGHTDAVDAHEKLVSHLLAALTRSQDSADFSVSWQRIAAHFEMLFTTEASIDALKQTLLQLAVMGKLVPQESDDEPASVLIDRLADDATKYAINLKISPPKPEPISVDALPSAVPNGWIWARLCSIFRVITDGDHQSPPQADEGISFLTIGNITTGNLDFSGCRFVSQDYFDSVAKYRKPGFGDILYTVVGATYGRPVFVSTHQEFCVQRHIAILKCSEHLNVRFACYLLSSPEIYEQATQCTTGTAQPTIPLRPLRNFLIRLPPLAEQHRIVAKVDELMALCNRMKACISDASALQRKLADLMVAQAVA
jgi:type I restriction enzyme S subunit